ncbi:MAG: hypothetical protein AAGJ97_09825, partial [Planctomycetota bacterium]
PLSAFRFPLSAFRFPLSALANASAARAQDGSPHFPQIADGGQRRADQELADRPFRQELAER